MKEKIRETIDFQDAMDNLAAIASLSLENPYPIGVIKRHRIVTTEEQIGSSSVQWIEEEGKEALLESLDLTYASIHAHLLHLAGNPEIDWKSEKMRKAIVAMMDLVGESVDKMEKFFQIREQKRKTSSLQDRAEFKALQTFYTRYFSPKFLQEGEKWDEEMWEKSADVKKNALQDFEVVRKDKEYELFYIRNEEGRPYFNLDLLRHIRLNCDFDLEGHSFEEDPLLKVRAMQDRDLQASAGQILSECHLWIVEFYRKIAKSEENGLCRTLNMALTALFLACNPRYLLQNTLGKSCFQYFEDFHLFLRKAFQTDEYQKLLAYPPDSSDKQSLLLLHLVHGLCRSLFERVGGVKLETIGLIHRTMRKGEEIQQKEEKKLYRAAGICNQFLLDDEKYRALLAKFPNGPLFKILDLIREEEPQTSFDPIGQNNLPMTVFRFLEKRKQVSVLKMACPTSQSLIHKAEVLDEFRGYLRALVEQKPKGKFLLINLQDRTSGKEFARSKALENLQMQAEFNHQLIVLTLPKDTDFYHQNNEYLQMQRAKDFMKAFEEQISSGAECGYFFPSALKQSDIVRFVERTLPWIHEMFFEEQPTLTRRQREDFIELFYHFFILWCIEFFEPTVLSFTCKDGLDTGAAQTASFYAFIDLLQGGFTKKEELDLFRWLLYTPALFVRERAIDIERFHRTLSFLEKMIDGVELRGKKIRSHFDVSLLYRS